jgi:hypothetical protein
VDPKRAPGLREEVQRLFAAIERQCGVRGRWMRRRDDPSTYMEVYEGIQDATAFEALMEREAAGWELERRVERFVSA